MLRKFLSDTYSSFVNPFPGCERCNGRERLFTVVRILFLISLGIMGNALINNVSHDIESQCCTNYAILLNRSGFAHIPAPNCSQVIVVEDNASRTSAYVTSNPLNESTTTTTLVCPNVTCPACQECVCKQEVPESVKSAVKNLRWDSPTSPCAQFGYAAGKSDCMEAVGVGKVFNGQPVHGTAGTVMSGSRLNNSVYSFMKDDGGFFLNASMWSWSEVNGSLRVVRK